VVDGAGGNSTTWVRGDNYVLFENVEPDGTNMITITLVGSTGDYDRRVMLNGFQLIEVAPVVATATTTTLVSSVNPSTSGQAVTFTATIAPASGTVVPTGTVQFKVDGTALDSPVTVTTGTTPNGTAQISTTSLVASETPHTVTAEYTATGSFTDSTGTLPGGQLVNTPFTTWIETNYPSLTDKTPDGDPDFDGMNNQGEFAFGLDPSNGALVNPITQQLDKTTGTFSYTRTINTGLTYTVLTSTDLVTWIPNGASGSQTPGTPVDGVEIVTVVVDATAADGKLFVRVQAAPPPAP
jgi:hypothetical protein